MEEERSHELSIPLLWSCFFFCRIFRRKFVAAMREPSTTNGRANKQGKHTHTHTKNDSATQLLLQAKEEEEEEEEEEDAKTNKRQQQQ